MKIEQLYIDGFGHFFQQEVGPLDPQLTVIYGPNEAGKSTLLAFIANVLFGFHQFHKVDTALSIPSLSTGRHGGRLLLQDDADRRYIVQRHATTGRSAGQVVVTVEGGSPAEDGALERLRAGATPELFRNVFAFDLDQLQKLNTLDNGEIAEAMYGVGMGVRNLAQTIGQFEKRMGEIYTPRGSTQLVAKKRRQLEDVDDRLRAIDRQAERYGQLLALREQHSQELAQAEHRLAVLRGEQRRSERIQSAWPDWVRLTALDDRLAALPPTADVPEDALARLEKAETELHTAQGEYEDAAERVRLLHEAAMGASHDAAALALADTISYVSDQRGAFVKADSDLHDLHLNLEQAQALQQAALRDLGPGWDAPRALSFDASIPVRNAVQEHKQALQQASEELRSAEAQAVTRSTDLREAEGAQQRLLETTSNTPPPLEAASLQQRRRQLAQAREQLAHVTTLRQAFQRAVAEVSARRPATPGQPAASVELPGGWATAREDLLRLRDLLATAERQATAATAAYVPRETDLVDAETELVRAQQVADAAALPELDIAAISQRRRQLEQARRQESELTLLRAALQREEELLQTLRARLSTDPTGGERSGIPGWLPVVLLLFGVAAVMAGVVLGDTAMWLGIGIGVLLVVAAAALFASSRTGQPSTPAQPTFDLVADQERRTEDARKRVTAVEMQLRQTTAALWPDPQTALDLDAVESRLQLAQARLAAWEQLQAAVGNARAEVARRGRVLEQADTARQAAMAGTLVVQQGWSRWLEAQSLPTSALPDRCLEFVAAGERSAFAAAALTEAENVLGVLARPLELAGVVDGVALDQADAELEQRAAALRTWEQTQTALQRAADEAASKRRLWESARELVEQTAVALKVAQTGWEQWLADAALDASFQPDTVLEMMNKLEAVRDRAAGIREREQAIARNEAIISSYRSMLDEVLTALGTPRTGEAAADVLVAADQAVARYDAAVQAQAQAAQAQRQADEAEQERTRRALALERAHETLTALLQLGGVADAEAFRRRVREQQERRTAEAERQDCLLRLQMVSGPGPAWNAFQAELAAAQPDAMKRRSTELADEAQTLDEHRTALLEERGRTDQETRQLESDASAAEVRDERQVKLEQLRSLAQDWAVLAVAKRLLERARQTYEREAQPVVIREASGFFAGITGGRYTEIFMPVGGTDGATKTSIRVVQHDKSQKPPNALSRGAREQLYLALRFGLIRQFGQQRERLPVIVDDALVNFDPERAQRAAESFLRLAETNQVLVFTCHPTTVALFRSVAPQTRVITLDGMNGAAPWPAGRLLE